MKIILTHPVHGTCLCKYTHSDAATAVENGTYENFKVKSRGFKYQMSQSACEGKCRGLIEAQRSRQYLQEESREMKCKERDRQENDFSRRERTI